jgi:hypothetical protein
MDAVTILLIIRALGELLAGIPELLKLLERDAAGETVTDEEIRAAIAKTTEARKKWDDSVAGTAAAGEPNP